MKYFDNSFDNYLKNVDENNLHPKLNEIYEKFPDKLSEMKNLIYYGPTGIGKYTQFLYSIKKYSPSKLKYEKKLSIEFNKQDYIFKISDIHYEIDMSLLGCNAKILWNETFQNILDIIISKQNKNGIILCKNFSSIHPELLDIFYSYMQKGINDYCNVIFCIITDNISFIPNNILKICKTINIKKPSAYSYNKTLKNKNKLINCTNITNIKQITNNVYLKNDYNKKVCEQIINTIKNLNKQKKIKYSIIRDELYDIMIYNLNIYDCVWYILTELINEKLINKDNIDNIMNDTYKFLTLYNNNYRPIYHLELFVLSLIKNIYGF